MLVSSVRSASSLGSTFVISNHTFPPLPFAAPIRGFERNGLISTVDQFAATIFAMVIRTVFLAVAIASVAGSAVAQEGNCTQMDDSSRPDCPGAIAFFHRVQSALQSKDRQ